MGFLLIRYLAGITIQDISGSQTSVFVGCFTNDYNAMMTKDLESYPKYAVTGTGNSILANRISYFYNLHGASATVDTACSSSLVCFHLGNQSIRNYESDLSIIVGSALHFDPNIFITMTDLGMLSTDGRSRAFDAAGKGYARGEGVCAAILKRKSQAQLDGDSIRAVVRGSLTNHDGRKQGITMPSSEAQEQLIRKTYQNAGLNPVDTQYFEAHGTGTAAGDPREARAIGAVFAPNREEPLLVGSVKTNIGHLEGASGLAALIKTTMSLEKQQIPPNMHFNTPNPNIPFDEWKLRVPTETMDWKNNEGPRRASINSFGYGGMNAHVILESYDPPEESQPPPLPSKFTDMVNRRPFLMPLTSHSEKAGKLWIKSLVNYLDHHKDIVPRDLAYSLSERRSMHRQRSFAVGEDQESIIKDLTAPQPIAAWTAASEDKPRLGFVFTGQGGQWFAMGRRLIEQSPLFLQTLEKCDQILQQLPDSPNWSVVDELLKSKETSRLGETEFSQPLCTALQLAILDLFAQWNIKPAAVVGHSSGEMAAAYAAGILSFESTIIAAYYRGLYMSNGTKGVTQTPGSMMAVGLTEPEAKAELEAYKGRVAIAAINSPSSMTLSGDQDAIIELKDKLTERKVFARQLQVTQAFHSHHMFPLAPGYRQALNGNEEFVPREAKIRMFSSVTARLADPRRMGADYWTSNMTGTVRFSDALTGILLDDLDEQNIDVLVEIGPHPALKGPSRQVVQSLKLDIPYVASLTRGIPDYHGLLTAAGQLFALGYPVDLVALNSDHFIDLGQPVAMHMTSKRLKNLPSYAWDHSRYWAETRVIRDHRLRADLHALLGSPVAGSVESHPRWRNFFRLSEIPWLSEHVVEGKIVFPAAGYICMAIEAIANTIPDGIDIKEIDLRDISVKAALLLAENDIGTEVILELRPLSTSAKSTSDSWMDFTIFSYEESGRCVEHCHGLISAERGPPAPIERIEPCETVEELRQKSERRCILQTYYQRLDALGLRYGENFKLLSDDIESGPGFAFAPLTFCQKKISAEAADRCILHPTLMDASLHVIFAAIESRLGRPIDTPFVPTFIRSMRVSGALTAQQAVDAQQSFNVCTNTELPVHRLAISDLRIHSQDSQILLVDLQGLQLTALNDDASEGSASRSLYFRTRWLPAFDFLGTSDRSSTFPDVGHLMDNYAHQHPNSKILHVTSDIHSCEKALRLLGGRQGERRRFQSYTPYSVVADDVSETFQALENTWPGLIEIMEPQEGEYDIIIIEEEIGTSVGKYVSPDGFIVTRSIKIETNELDLLFQEPQFQVWRKCQDKVTDSEPLTLVLASAASNRTQALADMIESSHTGPVSKVILPQLTERSFSDENIVVLANLDQDLFYTKSFEEELDYEATKKLLIEHEKKIVWLLEGATMDCQKPESALISGLARAARSENDQLQLVIFDVPVAHPIDNISQRILQLFQSRITEDEISERDGTLFIPRVEADDRLNSKLPNGAFGEPSLQRLGKDRTVSLKIGRVGLLETLVFADDETWLDSDLQDDELEIEVKASAINFRDVAASMGIIDDYKLGDECAGILIRKGRQVPDSKFRPGDRVVAWRPGQGAHCNIVRNPASLCYRLGPLPFPDAAAIPLILTTAYYALCDVARLKPGETVLIHSAAGGVGQMAIQIAQNIGANIIATVGSQSKRDLLKDKFKIKDEQIASSRDESFVKDVMRITGGKGVQVVLNSLSGKLLHATWGCVARFGRFIEIGKRDIHENTKIDMDPFRKNVTFASVDLITMFEHDKSLGARVFQECCQLVCDEKIKPPEPVTVLSYANAQEGFRLLQMGKHTGKVVLVPNQDDMVLMLPPKYRNTKLFEPQKTYLLVGGLGGLGRTLAEWMVRKGARRLAFLSRSGADREDARATVRWLEMKGIQVSVMRGDVTSYEVVESCIQSIGQGLAGIFQAAMVLQDSPLNQMTYEQWQTCVLPKVRGTYNLHRATLKAKLDFFVSFSSVSTILGSKAQANYSAANSYIDALMRRRREMGLKGTTMNCGMIVGVGAVAENASLQKVMERIGYDPVNEQELLYQVEEAVIAESTTSSARGVDLHQIITGVNLSRPDVYWAQKPLFRNLYLNHDFSESSGSSGTAQNLGKLLRTTTDLEKRNDILTAAFIEKIAGVLAVAADAIIPGNPLSAYGLDSIVAMEFRKWFSKTIGVDLALFDVLGAKSIADLVSKAASMIMTEVADTNASDQKAENSSKDNEIIEDRRSTMQDLSREISSVQKSENIPMSTFQSRLWFIHNLIEDKSFLNLPVIFSMKGRPDISAVQEALEELVKRNGILRTSYFEGDDFAEQQPVDNFSVQLSYQDFSQNQEPHTCLASYASSQQKRELNIESGEVFRVALVKLDESQYALVLVFHHISIDRGSSKSFLGQFSSIYDSVKHKKELSLVPMPKILYSDFTFWHNNLLQSSVLKKDIKFWKEKFTGASGVSKLLPFAKATRPPQNDFKRAICKATLGSPTLNRMKRICRRMEVTPFQFLLTAFRAFIYRYTEEKDLTILIIDGDRPHPDLEDVLGFFVNMIPIRSVNECDDGFDHLLENMRNLSIEAMEHNQVPFDAIVDAVHVEKASSHFPLGQVILNYQIHGKMPSYHTQDFSIDDITAEDVPTAGELSLEALEDPDKGLNLRLEYSTTLYDTKDMDCFFDNFLTFMTDAIKDHRQPISDIDMCSPRELDRLKTNYWATQFTENSWSNTSVLQKIFEMERAQPNAVAIKTSDNAVVTYQSLIDSARKIGFTLRRMGAVPGRCIGLFVQPGVEEIAGILGILLNRCGYVPMDPEFATDRLAFMAADSGAELILVGRGLEGVAAELSLKSGTSPQLLPVMEAVATESKLGLLSSASPQDPFYVPYTSVSLFHII